MAMQALRLRRVLTSLSSAVHRPLATPPKTPSPLPGPAHDSPIYHLRESLAPTTFPCQFSRCFSEGRQWKLYKEGDEITEDTVLFEGCDFNHWLITVDFPKDPKPSPEEMVATYERICAQGLNMSVEEAKKKIYACSTTTYQGFQAIMTEAESEKFKDVPGVVFVLPDSYIDPVNKEYGGDKYENGVITPRPPPYIAQRRERRPRYDQPRGPQNYSPQRPQSPQYNQQSYSPQYQQNPQYNQQMPAQGDQRNFGPPPNFPQQDPSFLGRRDHGPPQNFPRQDPGFPGRRDHVPPHDFPAQQHYAPPVQPQHIPMGNRDFAPGGWDNNQVNRGGPVPSFQSNYNQGPPSNYQPHDQSGFPQGNQRHYGSQGQTGFTRDNRNYSHPPGGSNSQGGYGQAYPGEGFSQMEQQQTTQPGTERARY